MYKSVSYLFLSAAVLALTACNNKEIKKETGDTAIMVTVDPALTFQTIDNFAASDAWSCQFVGNWPDDKKNAIADWLFSMDTLQDGSPKGIGLSAWRFNFGAGSAQQGEASGIKDEWRRAESFLDADNNYNWSRQQGQVWFLQAAKQRGVKDFIGFYNSPPVQYTRNRKAFASNKVCNIDADHYQDFATYITTTIKGLKQKSGVDFNYISPVNEPQWDWSDGGQEGSPYYNTDISGIVKSINKALQDNQLATQILLPEAGEYYYLYEDHDKPGKGSQVNAFFNETSPDYIGNLPHVSKTVAAHSYFTSSPFEAAVKTRQQVSNTISQINGLKFWQSEYCILGDNSGDIKGEGKDLGIKPALYLGKLIYNDLVNANAAAWQWWLAISPYDYKDGLVYTDMSKTDGKYYSSKMMWALGNYSRFVRPGMKRAELRLSSPGVYASAYVDENKKQIVIVAVNESNRQKNLSCNIATVSGQSGSKPVNIYTTTATQDLTKSTASGSNVILPAESVVTIVSPY
ncbi:MAG: xylanase [Chitinophagaceae bacterium]|nr:xylanase [Chitinophagaceae bacterium]